MRPALGTAILLLGILVLVMDSAAKISRDEIRKTCAARYPLSPCGSDGWYRLDEKRCMKEFRTWKNFVQAMVSCANIVPGGRVVLIKNLMDYNRVLCLFIGSSETMQPYWIGAMRSEDKKRTFHWLDGSKITFSRWNPGEPNDQQKVEGCVEMNVRTWGHWNDIHCWKTNYYICQKTE